MSGIFSLSDPIRKWSIYEFVGLEWTTSQPTEPGRYWAITNYEAMDVVDVVVIENGGSVWVVGCDESLKFKDFTHWLGPLPVPEPPQEKE
jgi:hypothetical protein